MTIQSPRQETTITEDQVERALRVAQQMRQLGQHREALDLLCRTASEHPNDARALVGWAEVLMELNQLEQARWRLDRAVEIDAAYPLAHHLSGWALLELKLPEEAARRFERIVNVLDPSSAGAYSGLGKARSALGDYEGAARMFERALEKARDAPAAAAYLLDLAEALQDLKLWEEVRETYRRLVELEAHSTLPLEQRYLIRRGSALLALDLRSWEEAISSCEEGLDLVGEVGQQGSPYAAMLHYLEGLALVGGQRYAEAVAAFGRAAVSEQLVIHSRLAVAGTLAFQGRYGDAWEALRGVEEDCAQLQEAGLLLDEEQRMSYGSALLGFERLEQAEAIFRGLLVDKPTNASAWTKLMMVSLERREQSVDVEAGHWQWEAYEAYRQVVPLLEQRLESARDARTLEALGLLHLLMDELDKADPLLAEAAALNPDLPMPHTGLGMCLVKRGRFQEAISEFKLALRRDPHDLTLQCFLADARFRSGQTDPAVEAYREVLRIAPGNVGAHIGMGEVLIEQAEKRNDDLLFEDAEFHLNRALELANSVKSGLEAPEGSTGLSLRQRSDLYYLRGYVLVKIYESLAAGQLGRAPGKARRRLKGARESFQEALETNVNPHRAERALERVSERLNPSTPSAIASSYGPYVVAGVSLLLLVLLQITFIAAGGFAEGNVGVGYTTLTLSLIVLLAAGFYLPDVLKLRFGGLELEKATDLQPASDAINIGRQHFGSDLHGRLEPSIPYSKEPLVNRSKGSSSQDARQGASGGKEKLGPVEVDG